LLLLARWQLGNKLNTDAARSGIFALVLSGFMFMGLNELHLAAKVEANWISVLLVGLTIVRLIIGRRWLKYPLPAPLLVSMGLWLLVMALPIPVLRLLSESKMEQHGVASLMCWMTSLLAAGHVPLVAWQKNAGFKKGTETFNQWWVPWLMIIGWSGLAVTQLYASMWSMHVDWAQWYFSPIFLAIVLVAVILSYAAKARYREAWVLLVIALLHMLVVSTDKVPGEFPTSWLAGAGVFLAHPFYSAGIMATLIFIATGIFMRQLWFFCLAAVSPVIYGLVQSFCLMWSWKHGKGMALLLSAFMLLGLGAAIQWLKENINSIRGARLTGIEQDSQTNAL
jgi:hypothetical protein